MDFSGTNTVFAKFMSFVDNMLWFSSLERNAYQGYFNGSESLAQGIIERGRVEQFQEFLRKLGIYYELVPKEVEGQKQLYCRFGDKEVNFYSVASRGTCSLILFYYWLIQLENVSLVFIDEFDAFYHFELSENIVKRLVAFN